MDNGVEKPNPNLIFSLFIVWALATLTICFGTVFLQHVNDLLAIATYVILITMLMVSMFRTGALNGVWFFLTPKWSKLLEARVKINF